MCAVISVASVAMASLPTAVQWSVVLAVALGLIVTLVIVVIVLSVWVHWLRTQTCGIKPLSSATSTPDLGEGGAGGQPASQPASQPTSQPVSQPGCQASIQWHSWFCLAETLVVHLAMGA